MIIRHWCLQLGILEFVVWLETDSCANAQSNFVPDDTLDTGSLRIIRNYQASPIEVITGGATHDSNLFHSFPEFNVSEGRSAYFFSPNADIQNILARVTGK